MAHLSEDPGLLAAFAADQDVHQATAAEVFGVAVEAVPADQRTGPVVAYAHRSALRKALKAAAKRAGVPYLSTHQVGRHTFATWMRQHARMDLPALKAVVGWRSINSAGHYAHVTPSETARAADLLPDPRAVQNPHKARAKRAKAMK